LVTSIYANTYVPRKRLIFVVTEWSPAKARVTGPDEVSMDIDHVVIVAYAETNPANNSCADTSKLICLLSRYGVVFRHQGRVILFG
jgi:hypothetical protein